MTFIRTGSIQTRYRAWGTTGSPVVLVPGAFETADTFAALAAQLGTDHRVFAPDLTGTGYSQPRPPFTVTHDAAQVLAFIEAMHLTGRNAPVLVEAAVAASSRRWRNHRSARPAPGTARILVGWPCLEATRTRARGRYGPVPGRPQGPGIGSPGQLF